MIITQEKFAYLQAVVDEGNITRAAEKLYISQPAVTNYINKVEKYYGIKLFNRTRNSVTLTYAGEKFMKGMGEIIHLQKKFNNDMEELANHRSDRITIGIGSTRGSAWLPYLLPAYKKAYPKIDIEIVEGNNSLLEQKLLQGTVDYIVSSLPIINTGIEYESIREERIYLIIPQKHPLLEGKDLTDNSIFNPLSIASEELSGQHFLISEEGQSLNIFVNGLFDECGITPSETTKVANSLTAFLLSCYGGGIAFAPDSTFSSLFPQKKPVIATIDNMVMSRNVVAAYNASIGLSIFTKGFINITKEVVNHEPKLQISSYWKK